MNYSLFKQGFIVIIFVMLLLYSGCGRGEKDYIRDEGIVWNTQYHIVYNSQNEFADSFRVIFDRLDASVSPFNPNSLISKINGNSTCEADEYLQRLYAASRKINRETGGAFDPTVAPLVNVWGFGYKSGVIPDQADIDSILSFVGMNRTSLKDGRILKDDERTSFNFSAIAKGMACDEIAAFLKRNGVEDYMVEIGGEIALNGVNPHGEKWHISVDRPVENKDSLIHSNALVIKIGKGGIATSGNYRNYKIVDGRKVVHIINPETGYSEITGLLSATVVAGDCMTADAYATACMVMGAEKCMEMFSGNKDIGVMLITSGGEGELTVWENARFRTLVVP